MELERPKWAYAIGTIGGALFALGALLMVLQLTASEPSASRVPIWLFGLGGAALGVCWVGTFKQGHAGFGAIGGSFLVPIAFAYIHSHREDWGALKAHGTLLLLAFAAFAAGHCFVRCLLWARWLAATAALVFLFQLVAITAKWQLERSSMKGLVVLSFAALSALGVALAIAIPKLYSQPVAEHEPPHEDHI
ncbi:MAG TPA: hypothetical protein VIV11_00170 [Kofleriaceae bacterium]